MAKFYLKNVTVTVNDVDLTDHISSVEVNLSKDEVETTNFGSGGGRERIHGLEDDEITLNFQQNFGTAEVDATLWPLWDDETVFGATVQPSSAAVSPTNPSYSGSFVLLDYTPLTGAVGDLAETSVTMPCTGTISRGTA